MCCAIERRQHGVAIIECNRIAAAHPLGSGHPPPLAA
jgi:hypothetical protein